MSMQVDYDIKKAFHSRLISTLLRLDIKSPESWELGYYWINKKAGLFPWT
jgi:hypothetical protein